jgi:hypothetical protein
MLTEIDYSLLKKALPPPLQMERAMPKIEYSLQRKHCLHYNGESNPNRQTME